MQKSYKTKDNFVKIEEPELVKAEPKVYNETNEYVAIRSRVDAKFLVTGAVTGKQYVFDRAGSVVNINRKDMNEILNKKRGVGCCGNSDTDRNLFELV
mgnify:CR=1 FL=1